MTRLDLSGWTPDALDAARPPRRPSFCAQCGGQTGQRSASLCDACLEAERAERLRAAIDETRIPERYRGMRFGSEALRGAVRRPGAIGEAQALSGRSVVVLRGGPGKGKTALAAAIALSAMAKGQEGASTARERAFAAGVRWTSAIALGSAGPEMRLGATPPAIWEATRATLLVLDELGREPDAERDTVFRVLYERHQHDRPTILTTWMTPEQIKDRYDAGFARRLLEPAHAVVIDVEANR